MQHIFGTRLIIGLISTLFCSAASAETQRALYSVTDVSWEPYWIVEHNKVHGILAELMQLIDKRIPVSLEPYPPLPVIRAQRWFAEGRIDIECCVNPLWRDSPEQANLSLWTKTVMDVEEILIFPAGHDFIYEKLSDLQNRRIATVRGYGYVGSEYFIRDDSGDNISQILKVASGRVDAGIIDRLELSYMLKHHPDLRRVLKKLTIGPVINRSPLKIRVHIQRSELLSILNEAIDELLEKALIENLVAPYYLPSPTN